MTDKQKTKLVRNIVKTVLYIVAIGAVFLVLGAILSGSTITLTVNWVKALIGIILFGFAVELYDWLFPAKRTVRRDDDENTNTKR